jgi:hypothetical protein
MEEVKQQLERLFLGKWVWELRPHVEGAFLVKFPSRVELQRAVAFGGADIKGAEVPEGARIKFGEWHEKETGFLLPKVWIRVYGLRKELREFLELWAVGTMLGSTQTVDMETTRKNNFGRVLVAVLNPSLIPKELDVVIADHYFELEFEVEKWGFDENGEEAAFVWNGGVGEEEGEEEGEGEGFRRVAKKQKRVEGSKEDVEMGSPTGVDSAQDMTWKEQVQNMSKEEFETFLREKAGEILGKAADKLFDELADKVVNEKGEEELEAAESGLLGEEGGDREVQKEILKAAAVPEASKMQVRASPRLQKSRDEHVLTKAQELAAKRNLEFGGGNSQSNSSCTVNRDIAVELLQNIGLDVGMTSDVKNVALQRFLDLEVERENFDGEGFEQFWSDSDSSEDNFERLELKALKCLCGEMMEEVFDESSLPLNSELDDYKRKGKSHAKSCLKKACKFRNTKFSKKGAR